VNTYIESDTVVLSGRYCARVVEKMAQTSLEVANLLVPGMHGAKKCRHVCREKPGPPAGLTVDPPICLTRSGSKCRSIQQSLSLPANIHSPPSSQAREATCLACIALEASALGILSRQVQYRLESGQGERTGTLFDLARQDSQSTLPLVVYRCAGVLRPRAAKRFRHSNPSFCLGLC